MNSSLAFLYDALNTCYDKGIQLLNNGNLESAIKQLYSAAESSLLIAKELSGEEREKMITRADEIIAFAEAIESRLEESKEDKPMEKEEPKDSTDQQQSKSGFSPSDAKPITFDDVIGLDEVKEEIRRLAIYPRQHPDIYEKFKKKRSAGILLYGVPGTGKTMIANAIAGELGATFFSIKCSDILSKWFGEAEQNIKALFSEAGKHKVSVIFFDEFDALGSKRDTDSSTMKRVIPELLVGIQNAEESENTLIVIAATNRPWDIDSAFLRPGRFNLRIHVPLPDEAARIAIIDSVISKVPCSEDLDVERIARLCDGFSGADIVNACERMKDSAIERIIGDGGEEFITNGDVDLVLSRTKSSVRKEDLAEIEQYREGWL